VSPNRGLFCWLSSATALTTAPTTALTADSLLQRNTKHTENKLKSLKARNEYLLSIDAANAATHKYFVDDLSLLIDVSFSSTALLMVDEQHILLRVWDGARRTAKQLYEMATRGCEVTVNYQAVICTNAQFPTQLEFHQSAIQTRPCFEVGDYPLKSISLIIDSLVLLWFLGAVVGFPLWKAKIGHQVLTHCWSHRVGKSLLIIKHSVGNYWMDIQKVFQLFIISLTHRRPVWLCQFTIAKHLNQQKTCVGWGIILADCLVTHHLLVI